MIVSCSILFSIRIKSDVIEINRKPPTDSGSFTQSLSERAVSVPVNVLVTAVHSTKQIQSSENHINGCAGIKCYIF